MASAAARIDELEQANALLRETVGELRRKLEWYERQLFHRTSERRLVFDPDLQRDLFERFGLELPPEREPEEETVVVRRRGPKRRSGATNDSGLRFDENVPVETIEVDDPAIAAIPEDRRVAIGEKVVHRLAQRPGSYVVLRYVTKTWKIKDSKELVSPAPPANVLERSVADVSLLAGILTDKFAWHIPLYRQHQRLEAAGIAVSRSSLTNWARGAIELLRPIYDAQCRSVLESALIAMDETSIKAGRTGPGKMRGAYFWPIFGDRKEIVFPYAPSRAHRHVEAFLGDYEGKLLSDGYQAYEAYAVARGDAVTRASCWAHCRREFENAKSSDPVRCNEALELIGGLYAHEKTIRKEKLTGAAKLAWRREHSVPIVEAFWEWIGAIRGDPSRRPKDPVLLAANYAHNQRAGLEVFLSDPDMPIDTNHLERALRVIPMGRRNWLFCWTELGAEHVGIIQSLIATCRLHGVDPWTWLVDVLQRVASHPAKDVAQLTPRLWKDRFAADPMTSDIGKGQATPTQRLAA